MKNGTCPKCNSSNIVMKNMGFLMGAGDAETYLQFWPDDKAPSESAECDNYVCLDCGYFESYIVDKASLEILGKKWTRVK